MCLLPQPCLQCSITSPVDCQHPRSPAALVRGMHDGFSHSWGLNAAVCKPSGGQLGSIDSLKVSKTGEGCSLADLVINEVAGAGKMFDQAGCALQGRPGAESDHGWAAGAAREPGSCGWHVQAAVCFAGMLQLCSTFVSGYHSKVQ